MIVVRDELKITPDGMKSAKETAKEMTTQNRQGVGTVRVLCDLIGEYYTLVIETEIESLAAYEGFITKMMADEGWQRSYSRLRPFVRGGKRSVYTVL